MEKWHGEFNADNVEWEAMKRSSAMTGTGCVVRKVLAGLRLQLGFDAFVPFPYEPFYTSLGHTSLAMRSCRIPSINTTNSMNMTYIWITPSCKISPVRWRSLIFMHLGSTALAALP